MKPLTIADPWIRLRGQVPEVVEPKGYRILGWVLHNAASATEAEQP